MSIKTKHIVLIAVSIIALFAIPISVFYGYKSYLAPKNTTTQTNTPEPKEDAPAISSKEDLSKAADKLNEVNTSTKQVEDSLEQLVK